jgi:hypothetical protein
MGHISKKRRQLVKDLPEQPLDLNKVHMHQAEDVHNFPGSSLDEVQAIVATSPKFRIGQYIVMEDLPYLGKLINVQVDVGQDGPIVREFIEPVPPREAVAHLYPKKNHSTKEEENLYEVERVAFLLRQEDWYRGLSPEDQWFFCEACLDTRSAYGANRYDVHAVCNKCVRNFEEDYIFRRVHSFNEWFELTAAINHWHRFVDKDT